MLVLFPLRNSGHGDHAVGELIPESALWPNQRSKVVSNTYGAVPLACCPQDVRDAVKALVDARDAEIAAAAVVETAPAPKRKKLSKEPMTAADLTIEEAVAVSPQASDDPFTV